LGDGSSCDVYQAFDTILKKNVALKIIDDDICDKLELVNFEVEVLNKISQHKNITKLYKSGTGQFVYRENWSKEVEYLVLSYEEGGDFFDYITS
jgi:serine/threonine protein kinase